MRKKQIKLSAAASQDAFQTLFIAQWKKVSSLRKKVLKKFLIEDIHNLRIALRYFLLMINIFETIANKPVKKRLKKLLRSSKKKLSKLRNIDEALLFFSGHDYPHFYHKLEKKRLLECNKIHKQLLKFNNQHINDIEKILKTLRKITFDQDIQTSLIIYFTKLIHHDSRIIKLLIPDIMSDEKWKSLHPLRIFVRKLRYTLEIISIIFAEKLNRKIKILKQYQTILGCLNDVDEFRALTHKIRLNKLEMKRAKEKLLKKENLFVKKLEHLLKNKSLTTLINAIDKI